MDANDNTDNTNPTPTNNGTNNDLGNTAEPSTASSSVPTTESVEPVTEMNTAVDPAQEAASVVTPIEPTPAEPISGMSAPIDDAPVEPVPVDLPAVNETPPAETTGTPENIPVEPAPTDSTTPDANQQLGSF